MQQLSQLNFHRHCERGGGGCQGAFALVVVRVGRGRTIFSTIDDRNDVKR
jgi:hypothetical protein